MYCYCQLRATDMDTIHAAIADIYHCEKTTNSFNEPPQNVLITTLDIDPVLFDLELHMKYTVEVVPLRTYIVWFVIV